MSPSKCKSEVTFEAEPNTSTIPADTSQGKEDETYKTDTLEMPIPKPNFRHVSQQPRAQLDQVYPRQYKLSMQTGR